MQYVTHRRFQNHAICGDVNLQYGEICELSSNVIMCNSQPICVATSENAHQYFARNDDGNGLLRGKLTQAIQKTLATRDDDYQARWGKVWADPWCQPYKRKEHGDFWVWNHDFYNADIMTLKHIAVLVGVKEV